METEIYKLMLNNNRVALLAKAKELGIKNMDTAKKIDMATAIVNHKPEIKKFKPRIKTPTASVADSASVISEPVADVAQVSEVIVKQNIPQFTFTGNQVAKWVFTLYCSEYTSEYLLLKQIYQTYPEFIQVSGNHTSYKDKEPHLTLFTGLSRDKRNVMYHIYMEYKNGKWLYKYITTFDKNTNSSKTIAKFS
jgi:hypothetical protein